MMAPTLMQQKIARVADIRVGTRLRPVSPAGVESLIASITETGVMKDAVHVRKKHDGTLWLIAGAHRLAAAQRMGWTEVEVKVWTDVTDDWAALMEIDDNLAGAEMNALDTAVFLAERKAVYERLHPEAKADAFRGNQHTGKLAADIMSFATSTAEKFGLTDRHVRRMIAVGGALGADQVAQLRSAPRPVKLTDLIDLAKMDSADRTAVVARLAAGAAKSAAEARRLLGRERGVQAALPSREDAQYIALLGAWTRASVTARRRFVSEVYPGLAQLLRDEADALGIAPGAIGRISDDGEDA